MRRSRPWLPRSRALNGVDGKVAALRSTIDGVQKQSSATQASIGTLQSGQKALEGKVTTSAGPSPSWPTVS